MLARIVKQYNNLSDKNGIIETDTIRFNTNAEALEFIAKVNANKKINYNIIDYDLSGVQTVGAEILENPTGGLIGRLKNGK